MRAEVWAAKTKAFLPIQGLILRVLKQRKFKHDEGVSLNEQGQLFYLQMITKCGEIQSDQENGGPHPPMPRVRPRNLAYHCQI